MKVIHLISGGDTGGAKTHVHSLLANLRLRMDVTMVCFTDGPFAREARALGIPTEVLSGHNILRTLRLLKEKIRAEGYDIIHCHGARGNLMGALLSRSTGLPTVSTVHSDYRLDYLGRPVSRLTYGTINSIALRVLKYRIGVSDAMVDLLISRGFDPGNLFTIYNGLDFTPRAAALSRAEFFRAVGLEADADCVVAGIAARLNPVKDIATLIRGFALAHRDYEKLRLLIAGDGEDKEALEKLAQDLGVGREVCFAGWVSDTDSFYQAIDINTLTSLSETFPYALTEGARAALPTVSSRVGGVPYLIDHGANGFLFPVGDAEALARHLLALARDPKLRKTMGTRLYDKAKREFSLEATVSRQEEIYRTILRREKAGQTRNEVVICGAYGKGNAGDDAILLAILTELRSLDPDLSLQVLSRRPRGTRMAYRVSSFYTFNLFKFLRHIQNARLYINGGGSLMQDVTSHRSLWFYLYTIAAAKKHGCPVLMYGCGIGPIHSKHNRRRAAGIMQTCADAITLRDPHSLSELADMGVTAPDIRLTADPTVILAPAEPDVVDGLLESRGLDPEGRYIAFILRPWPGFDSTVSAFAEAAQYAYEVHGLTPVFFPIEPRRDVNAGRQVAALLSCPYVLLEETGNAAQTIGMLSRMKAAVSMRLHGLVFAADQGVPLVGIVYDPKVSSFLSYIGQDLYTDLKSVTAEGLKDLIRSACGRDPAFLSHRVELLRRAEAGNRVVAAKLLGLDPPAEEGVLS